MTNLISEIARRATLQDIIEKAKEADQHLNKVENATTKCAGRFLNYGHSFLRGGFRVTGALELMYAGYLISNYDELSKAALFHASTGVVLFVLDSLCGLYPTRYDKIPKK